MKKPEITLNEIRKNSPKMGRVSRVSDFVTEEEVEKLRMANLMGKRKEPKFDRVDAFVAEMIARFGYEFYEAWNNEEIDDNKVARLINAERAREAEARLPLEEVIINMVGSCVRVESGQPKPKGIRTARNRFKQEVKQARGEA